jgi:hypothetical protein
MNPKSKDEIERKKNQLKKLKKKKKNRIPIKPVIWVINLR